MPATPSASPHCANCGQHFGAGPPAFCPACGQESRVRAPTMGEFLQQFGGAYLSTEGALWRTLRLLLLKPGELTRHYLAGRRKHFVLPLRLYLTISLVALLLIRVFAGQALQVQMPELDVGKGQFSVFNFGDGSGAGLRDGKYYCDGLPAWLCKRLQRRLDTDPKGMAREVVALSERFVSNVGGALFLLLPLFALFMKLLWWSRRMHYTEHLVFGLHLHAFWFVCLMLTLPDLPWLTGPAVMAIPVYGLMATRRVYGGRWFWLLLRSSVVSLLYLVTLSLLLVGVILWSLLF
jgi:hypothetical protein